MHCHEARHRLIESPWGTSSSLSADPELAEHLAACPDCAREAEAVAKLRHALDAAGEDDTADMTPLAVQMQVVQARADRARQTRPMPSLASRLGTLLFGRPRLAVGLVLAAVAVTAILMSPSRDGQIVGYNLSVYGVSLDLATDDERLCDMLYALGATDAGVDLIGCDTTCNLLIFDLRSPEEARLVVAAIRHLSTDAVTTNIVPVLAHSSDI